jgi:hypothetical protein
MQVIVYRGSRAARPAPVPPPAPEKAVPEFVGYDFDGQVDVFTLELPVQEFNRKTPPSSAEIRLYEISLAELSDAEVLGLTPVATGSEPIARAGLTSIAVEGLKGDTDYEFVVVCNYPEA